MGTTHSRRLKGGLGDGHSPTDENDAEKAQGGRDYSKPAEPQTNGEGAKPKVSDFREDARIWQLYLEKAEESANEKATLWTTGLDSLLIFAGLFAGIVAGFVIDIRSDLQPDRAPRLLSDILDFLRNVASSDTSSDTPNSVYWIHGLWIMSLFTTISSAILGVLAKAWLAKYIPAKNRGTSKDAYRRYKLDIQAERLYLKEVLVLAPLLVQLASALFLAGLILQALGDVPAIGRTLLCLCLLGVLGYFLLTVFPLFIRSSPFNTPLSELSHAVYTRVIDKEVRPAFEPKIDDGLGEILYRKLIKSGKSVLIEEVVAEVARGLKPIWIDFLCKNKTPGIILLHLQEYAASRTADEVQKHEVLGNYLLALLHFTELYEEKLSAGLPSQSDTREPKAAMREKVSSYRNLDTALRDALDAGKPLHRWNELPIAVRPLLFALRVNLLALLPPSERYTGTARQTPNDFSRNELAERPWDMLLGDIPASHRIHFMLAAHCGLVRGGLNLQKASSFILCLSLTKASFTISEKGETIEWASSTTPREQERVQVLMLRCLSRLYRAIVSGWENMAADALRDTLPVEVPTGTEATLEATVIPKLLLLSLSQPDSNMRAHSFKMLKHCLASAPEIDRSSLVQSIGKGNLKRIADIAVLDDQGMQDDALELLIDLVEGDDDTTVESVGQVVAASILSKLENLEDTRMSAIRSLVKLSTRFKINGSLFISVMAQVVPKLKDLNDLSWGGLKANHVRNVAARSLGGSQALKTAILRHLSQMFDTCTTALETFLEDLSVVVERTCHASAKERNLALDGLPWPFNSDTRSWTFPWDLPLGFVREFLHHRDTTNAPSMLQKLVATATSVARSQISDPAGKILKLLCTWESSYFAQLKVSIPPDLRALLPSPTTQDLGLASRWVKLLASMPPRSDLRTEVSSSLQHIMSCVKATVYAQKDARASEDPLVAGLNVNAKSAHIIHLLYQAKPADCMDWIDIFSTLAYIFPDQFADAPDFLFEILWHFRAQKILHVPLRALNGLVSLGKQAAITSTLRDSLVTGTSESSNFNRMARSTDWHVRLALPQLLTDLKASTELRLTGPDLTTLRKMALEDGYSDVRSKTIEFLTDFFSKGEGPLSHASTTEMEEMNLSLFDQGIKDGSPSPRKSWLQFVVPYIKDASSPRITSILGVAIDDSNSLVRIEASNMLYRLLNNTKTRASYASTLAGLIAPTFKDRARYIPTASLLVHLTSNKANGGVPSSLSALGGDSEKLYPLTEFNGTLAPGHDAWVRLVMFLGRHGFERVSDIIEAAIKAEAGETFRDLKAAFAKLGADLLAQMRENLLTYLNSALSEPEPRSNDRLESVNLLTSLLHDEQHAYGLLGGPMDTQPQLMLRLAEASVKSDEARLRQNALNLLRSLLTNNRFRDSIRRRCSDLMGTYLSGQEAHKHQENILRILYRLTAADIVDTPTSAQVGGVGRPGLSQESPDRYASLNEIISPHISLLLKLTLLVGDQTHHGELRKHAEGILLENLKTYPGGSTLIEDVLSAIPSMVPIIPAEGKQKALNILDALPVRSEGKALSIAHALVPFLGNPSSFARATALELLSRLHRQYQPELIGSATQEIVSLALKDSLDEIRITAIQLLSALATPFHSPDELFTKLPVLKPSIQLAAQFIPLLQNENLRPSVVELLSVLAMQHPVRRAISLKIMTSSFGPDSTLVEAHTELLARLVSDGRFLSDLSDEATDKVMLFFASAVVAKPELARYRFEMLTALWCRYSRETVVNFRRRAQISAPLAEDKTIELETADESTAQLVDWFTFATFGSHPAQDEIEKCLTRCALWLPKLTLENLKSEVSAQPAI